MATDFLSTFTGPVSVVPKRSIGGIVANATLEESHTDELEITNQPVDQGAAITDHAYMLPRTVTIKYGFSASSSPATAYSSSGLPSLPTVLPTSKPTDLNEIYEKFLALQTKRTLVEVFTARRKYTNMLVKSLRTSTNVDTERAMVIEVSLQQVTLVTSQTVTIAASNSDQKYPEVTAPLQQGGSKSTVDSPAADQAAAARAINPSE